MNIIRCCVMVTILLSLHGVACSYQVPYKALVVVPVADLVTEPLSSKYSDVEQAYRNIPISWGPLHQDKTICPRQHQALFNEQVNVTKVQDKEVCVEITNAFSQTTRSSEPHTTYWTLKKNTCPLEIIPHAIQHYIPQPLDYRDNDWYQANIHIATLTWPLYDSVTKLRYSAGTRFVYGGSSGDAYVTYIYDYSMHSMRKIMIPKRYAFIGMPASLQARVSNFVTLLRDWARAAGFIPLVWGGISFTRRNTMEGFALKYASDTKGNRRAYWQLHEDADSVYTGFDASGLVLRAAQICGIPYFFKNTTAAEQHIRHIVPYEQLQEGDLFWIPGGLLIVSDLAHNKIIGAFGYQFGFGKVIERSLSDVFEGIATYDDVMRAYKDQRPLGLKNNKCEVYTSITNYAFLKLASLWEK